MKAAPICINNINTIKIVCQLGISTIVFVSLIPISHKTKQILAIGDITNPKMAIKLAKKSGILSHLKNICITVSTNKTLHIMANLAIKAKKALLKIWFIIWIKLQDKKITQKGFLVVGL